VKAAIAWLDAQYASGRDATKNLSDANEIIQELTVQAQQQVYGKAPYAPQVYSANAYANFPAPMNI
jgi:hypothetical protein